MNATTLQGQYAGIVTRGIAVIIDLAIIAVALLVYTWGYNVVLTFIGIPTKCTTLDDMGFLYYGVCLAASGIQWAVTVFLAPVYYIFFWTLGGQTPGKALMGVRVVRLDAKPVSVGRSVRRFIGYIVCAASLGLGFAWAILDDRRQGWDDKLAGTVVLYSWQARQNDVRLARVRNRLARGAKAPPDQGASAAS
jgi:uncharacterized RDD family membrane protein YckC